MRKKSELFFSLVLVPLDYAALLTAFVVAYILRVKIDDRPVATPIAAADFLQFALTLLPVWIFIFCVAGLYTLRSQRRRFDEAGKVLIAVSGGSMFLILLDFLQPTSIFPSKLVPVYGYALGIVLVLIMRTVVRQFQRRLFKRGIGVRRTLIIGSGDLAIQISKFLSKESGYRVVGCLDSARGAKKRMSKFPVFKTFDQVIDSLGRKGFDDIIQADSALSQEDILDVVTFATNNHVIYRFVPNQFGLYAVNSELGYVGGMPIVELKLTPLDGWGRILKRAFDIVGSTVTLLCLSPVFAVISLLIKIRDPGPIFFQHRRLSRTGDELYMYKFRSMRHEFATNPKYIGKSPEEIFEIMGLPKLAAEFKKSQKVKDDPRVSGYGRFLRSTSLDELPQLLNVIKGDMSLVGPRPVVPVELERYGDYGASFLALKPGITGLWQTSGRSDTGYDERIKLDIYYVEHWSLWLDIKILIKTVFIIISRKGAY